MFLQDSVAVVWIYLPGVSPFAKGIFFLLHVSCQWLMKEVLSAVFRTMGNHEGRVILILRAPLSFKLMEAWEYSSYPTAKWRQVPASEHLWTFDRCLLVNICISRIGSSCFMDRHSGVVVICSFWGTKLSTGLKCAKWTRKKFTADEIIFCHKNWVIPTKQTFKQTY